MYHFEALGVENQDIYLFAKYLNFSILKSSNKIFHEFQKKLLKILNKKIFCQNIDKV